MKLQAVQQRARGKNANGAGENNCWIVEHRTDDEHHYIKTIGIPSNAPSQSGNRVRQCRMLGSWHA